MLENLSEKQEHQQSSRFSPEIQKGRTELDKAYENRGARLGELVTVTGRYGSPGKIDPTAVCQEVCFFLQVLTVSIWSLVRMHTEGTTSKERKALASPIASGLVLQRLSAANHQLTPGVGQYLLLTEIKGGIFAEQEDQKLVPDSVTLWAPLYQRSPALSFKSTIKDEGEMSISSEQMTFPSSVITLGFCSYQKMSVLKIRKCFCSEIHQIQTFLHCLHLHSFEEYGNQESLVNVLQQETLLCIHPEDNSLVLPRLTDPSTKQHAYTHGFLQLLPEIVILLFELPRIRNRLQREL